MKVLLLHNRYRHVGGEDMVAQAEAQLLSSHGIDLVQVEVDNGAGQGALATLSQGVSAAWSEASYARVASLCERHRPDVAHVHNFWMMLSPSVHAACQAAGVPTVQTLHNYRLFCTNALFLRNGKVCQDCLGHTPWRGVVRRCYRGSLTASAAVARMMVVNRRRHTWQRDVDAFIALSDFSRRTYIEGGLPEDRIYVKPNFAEDLGPAPDPPSTTRRILYVGRLSEEKSVDTLLSAWPQVRDAHRAQLLIFGDGPDRPALEAQARALGLQPPDVVFAGARPLAEVRAELAQARTVVLPSRCFENFPRVIAEAFCAGRPVIVSDLGPQPEIVTHERLGLTFPVDDSAALAKALERLLGDDDLVNRLGQRARQEYLDRYAPGRNYEMLIDIYRKAIERRRPAPLLPAPARAASA